MNAKIFIAVANRGLSRAEQIEPDQWSVETLLEGQDPRCLAADPQNHDVIYAGTQGNGLWRSVDWGENWEQAGMEDQIVKSVAVSPHDSNTIYVGTKPAYLFVSHDAGRSWNELDGFRKIRGRQLWFSPAEKPYKAYVSGIALSPTDPNRILAGIEFGAVIRSEDGGQTWSNHIPETLRDCHTLKFHAANGDWVYEAGGTGGGASVSRDGGRTWRKTKSGLAKNYGVACAADPKRPEIWYVSVAPSPGKAYGQQAEAYLYRASGGADWHPIGWEPHPMSSMPTALVTDPAAPGHLYAGLTNGEVWHSTNHGDNWDKLPFQLNGIWFSLLVLS
jgi:photosystem II stability/assembly factor-like uncharacterized protein